MLSQTRIFKNALSLLILFILLCSCSQTNFTTIPSSDPTNSSSATLIHTEPTATSSPRYTLRVGLSTENNGYNNLDPKYAGSSADTLYLRNIYEGLTLLDSNLAVVSGAAESWEYNSDATMITFKLFQNLKYSDGTPLNAKRFEYAIKRVLIPDQQWSYGSEFLRTVKGAENLHSNYSSLSPEEQASLLNSVQVTAMNETGSACTNYDQLDCLYIQIKFNTPTPNFHRLMTLVNFSPVKEEIITSGSVDWWKTAENHIGNGLFVLSKADYPSSTLMVPNPNHYSSVAKYSLEYLYYQDSDLSKAYLNNEIDIMPYNASTKGELDNEVIKNELLGYSTGSSQVLVFNLSTEPFQDPEVRKAFAYAFNREQFLNDIFGDMYDINLSWIPKGFPGYDASEDRWDYDPIAAIDSLHKSEYYDSQSGKLSLPTIHIIYYHYQEGDMYDMEWNAIKKQFEQVFGNDVVIELEPTEDRSEYRTQLEAGKVPMFFGNWGAVDNGDPQEWLKSWLVYNMGRDSNYSTYNPEFTHLMELAEVEPDEAIRNQKYEEAQDILIGDVPAIFGWSYIKKVLIKPWVTGIKPSPFDIYWPGSLEFESIILN
jgi:oligopeptide transport system substrate-binding protein